MTHSKKVLITDYVHPILVDSLSKAGYTVDYQRSFDPRNLEQHLGDYYGMIINSKIKMTASRISAAKNLKFIARLGSGLDIIDLPAAQKKDILIISAPEGNRNAVAEHVMALLLNLTNKINRGHQEVSSLIWNRESNRGIELSGKTIGIIGFGNTGSSLAKKLAGWEMEVLVYDPLVDVDLQRFPYVKQVGSLHEIQEQADIISLHVQLTDATYHLIDREFLENIKKSIILINTSRGKVLDTEAVIEALENNKVKYLALDVFEEEKPIDYSSNYLMHMRALANKTNVLLTPHVAGWTQESLYKISNVIIEKLKNHKYL